MNILKRLLLATALVIASASASAELVDQGHLTLDTVTGRKWLDLSYTSGWSVDRARSELSDFTIASGNDVYQFFQNAGLTLTGNCNPMCIIDSTEWTTLLDLGEKLSPAFRWSETGFIGQGFTINPQGDNGIGLAAFSSGPNSGSGDNQISVYPLWIPSSWTPGYIHSVWAYTGGIPQDPITSPVPEPATYGMMLAGLGMMGFIARRRKQKEST